ncbi:MULTISPECIES: MFS transporter [unclassified Frankia]|uniref:MFS transporter n=1 Tax=unclassified Frankia TaxID=2632575 RepID=UPI0020255ED1
MSVERGLDRAALPEPAAPAPTPAPTSVPLPRRAPDGVITALACLGQFMVVLDVSIVNVALPSIHDALGFSTADLPWVVNAYTLTFAGFMLLGGRAADLYGRKRVFVAGVALFTVASVLGGAAPSAGVLVTARALQGLGAAILAPCTLTILTTTFPEGARRARAIAAWTMVGAVGGAAGAILGGLLTDYLGWRWILLVNLPVGVAVVAGSLRWLADLPGLGGRSLDVPGAVTVSAGLTAVAYGIVQAGKDGWSPVGSWLPIVVGALLLALFVVVEQWLATVPLLPLRLLRSALRSGANVVMFLLGAGFFGLLYFVSLYLQNVRGYSPVEAGLVFVPHAVATVVGARTAARLLAAGRRPPVLISAGLLISAAGFGWQAALRTDTLVALGVIGPGVLVFLGIGVALTPVAVTAMAGVQPQDAGVASGLANAARQVGGSFGLVVLTSLAAAHTSSRPDGSGPHPSGAALTSGYDLAFITSAAILVGCVLITLLLPWPPKPKPAAVPEG